MSKPVLQLDDDGTLRVPAIVTQRVSITDDTGGIVGVLSGEVNGVSLILTPPGKPVRVVLGVNEGGAAGLLVNDPNGNVQLAIASYNGVPSISFRQPNGSADIGMTIIDGVPCITSGDHSLPFHEVLDAITQLCKSRIPKTSQN